MDHARCIALHNSLATLAARGNEHNLRTYSVTHGSAFDHVRARLHPSVIKFLEGSLMPTCPIFFYADTLSPPDSLIDDGLSDFYAEPDSLLCLYPAIIGQGGAPGGGLFYHQHKHVAAFFNSQDEYEFALPLDEGRHATFWHPLEEVLSHWHELVRLDKIRLSDAQVPSQFGSEKVGGIWEWRPYGDVQVDLCAEAWDRLCQAIEKRLPGIDRINDDSSSSEALVSTSALDEARIPDGFAKRFLARARRPRGIRRVAPGLALPPADPAEFAATQIFTRVGGDDTSIPAVMLFGTEPGHATNALLPSRPVTGLPTSEHPVPAGLYSESVQRNEFGNAEEGFRLLLPFALGVVGGRKSDGTLVADGARGSIDLFQHGYKPFGGSSERAQRLEVLFEHWRGLVERGTWGVGSEGVLGGVETFRDAEGEASEEYWIPPSW